MLVSLTRARLDMASFFGSANYNLDPKNRLFIPARLRDALKKEEASSFVVTTGSERCLYVFLPSQWDALQANNMAAFKSDNSREAAAFKRFFFSNAAEAPVDSMGRILITQSHCQYAGLKKRISIIGVGNKAEIWDEARWRKYHKQEIVPNEHKFSKIYDI